jgi:cytochrome c peroxidase
MPRPLPGALGAAALVLALGATAADTRYRLPLPDWMPEPPPAITAGLSEARIALGRRLFYDTRLSANGSMSCASCHQQERAFTDGQVVHTGVHGEPGVRNVPGLANLAYMPVLNWANPTLRRLEAQVLIPIFGDHPVEMGRGGQETALFASLAADPAYAALLRAAYPDKSQFDLAALTGGLAAFLQSIVSFDSPYDRYRHGGEVDAIPEAAKRGEALFFSEELECAHCHGGRNFTDNFQSAATPFPEIGFHNTGLYNLDGRGAYPGVNAGVRLVTGAAEDEGRFRSPSLRNVALTAPYMHDGSLATLADVIRRHYALGGMAAAGPHGRSPIRDPLITGFTISEPQVRDLVSFLESLTDTQLTRNPAYGKPADLP